VWRAGGEEGSGNSPVQDPTTSIELRCHASSSAQTHLTGVWPRELLCYGSDVLKSWDPIVIETWIKMFKEELKHISSLLMLDASVDAFLEA
jgi:hypothetical protein